MKNIEIKLWRENKIDQEYKMTLGEIADAFIKSKYNTSGYLENYPLIRLITIFISNPDGLNSVFEDYEKTEEIKSILLASNKLKYEVRNV